MMTTKMSPVNGLKAVDESAPAHIEPHPTGHPTREDWLFRDALRNQTVHPLMELVRRYREQDAP
jgi:hypothetical protein